MDENARKNQGELSTIKEIVIGDHNEKVISNNPKKRFAFKGDEEEGKKKKKINIIEELRYSLRSILQYIPWIRKIFIVMPNDKVRFLKPYDEIKDKIVYVKDKDLLGYDTANIFAFTFNLHKMEKFGIAKNFIYMEDDFFIGKPLKKTDFFYYDEKEQKYCNGISSFSKAIFAPN